MKFDPQKPHGVVFGHSTIRYAQNGEHYDTLGQPVVDEPKAPVPTLLPKSVKVPSKEDELLQPTGDPLQDKLNGAKVFLMNILKDTQLSKAEVYRASEQNNQDWALVTQASNDLGVKHIMGAGKTEMWKLVE